MLLAKEGFSSTFDFSIVNFRANDAIYRSSFPEMFLKVFLKVL